MVSEISYVLSTSIHSQGAGEYLVGEMSEQYLTHGFCYMISTIQSNGTRSAVMDTGT